MICNYKPRICPLFRLLKENGIGVDITSVMREVVDAAVETAYGGARKIAWMEIYAGEKAASLYGDDDWLPKETLKVMKRYAVSVKGR